MKCPSSMKPERKKQQNKVGRSYEIVENDKAVILLLGIDFKEDNTYLHKNCR